MIKWSYKYFLITVELVQNKNWSNQVAIFNYIRTFSETIFDFLYFTGAKSRATGSVINKFLLTQFVCAFKFIIAAYVYLNVTGTALLAIREGLGL